MNHRKKAKQMPTHDIRHSTHSLLGTRPAAWLFSRTLPTIDKFFFRITGGRFLPSAVLAGLPIILLTTTGAKSGQPRYTPLVGIPDGKNYIVIASNFGQTHHPAWYFNLRANPVVTVTFRGKTMQFVARQAEGTERDACWNKALYYYKSYNAYKARAEREIPVFILEPYK